MRKPAMPTIFEPTEDKDLKTLDQLSILLGNSYIDDREATTLIKSLGSLYFAEEESPISIAYSIALLSSFRCAGTHIAKQLIAKINPDSQLPEKIQRELLEYADSIERFDLVELLRQNGFDIIEQTPKSIPARQDDREPAAARPRTSHQTNLLNIPVETSDGYNDSEIEVTGQVRQEDVVRPNQSFAARFCEAITKHFRGSASV
jgi:hypothetical protein